MMRSYSRGPDAPLLELTIHQALVETAARFPHRDALVSRHQGRRFTWSRLLEEVHRTARGLTALGLKPGDRIGIWSTNCAEWILLQLASAECGVVLVNVNPAYRSYELRYVLDKSRMKVLFLRERDTRADYRAILEEAGHQLEHVIFLEHPSWDAMIEAGSEFAASSVSATDVANIQYTSGTTGSPKGVLLTHRNILNNGKLVGEAMHLTSSDKVCAPVPLYHCFGCVMASLACVVHGATLILPAASFDPLATLAAVHEERATALYGVPTMFIAELNHPEFRRFDLSSLRTGIMAGAPCPIEVMKRVISEMHCRDITIAYGQTESSPVVTQSRVGDEMELRVSTVGCAMPNTEVKIASRLTGETVPIGEIGEVCARGYAVMKGYDGMSEATAEAIDGEGWLHTGDLGVMHANGYFGIRGRLKEMIIRGGENIYPREIEEFLYTHPAVADVYVIGVPDEKLGETVGAWIRLKAGAEVTDEDIRRFCKGRIAHFKVPHYIRFTESFPMTVTGKVQKYLMRQQEIRDRGLERAAQTETA